MTVFSRLYRNPPRCDLWQLLTRAHTEPDPHGVTKTSSLTHTRLSWLTFKSSSCVRRTWKLGGTLRWSSNAQTFYLLKQNVQKQDGKKSVSLEDSASCPNKSILVVFLLGWTLSDLISIRYVILLPKSLNEAEAKRKWKQGCMELFMEINLYARAHARFDEQPHFKC